MPQMAPIGWLSLFIIFSVIFIMFNIMNYFFVMPQTPGSEKSNQKISKSLNWKW